MEKKKMRIWKKILIILGIIFIILLVFASIRFSILTKIHKRGVLSNQSNNVYYCSETEDTILESWKKDGVIKQNVRQKNGNGNLIFWKNKNTNDGYTFTNSRTAEKTYTNEIGGLIENIEYISDDNDIRTRLFMAINPIVYIGKKEYKGKECYYISSSSLLGGAYIIDKETGLTICIEDAKSGSEERTIEYIFNQVTDEDVKLPNLEEYTFKENT